MKIPTSSSLILATLAISSSSASLAAPTGDGSTEDGLSQIRHRAESLHHPNQALENEEVTEASVVERGLGDPDLHARNPGVVPDIIASIPVVGPILESMLATEYPDTNNPSSQGAPDPAEIQRVQDAISTISSALAGVMPTGSLKPDLPSPSSGVPVPVPLSNDNPGVDPNDPSATPPGSPPDPSTTPAPAVSAAGEDASPDNGSFLISPTTTVANAQGAPTQDPTFLSSFTDSGTPTSPAGPPNTPIPTSASE